MDKDEKERINPDDIPYPWELDEAEQERLSENVDLGIGVICEGEPTEEEKKIMDTQKILAEINRLRQGNNPREKPLAGKDKNKYPVSVLPVLIEAGKALSHGAFRTLVVLGYFRFQVEGQVWFFAPQNELASHVGVSRAQLRKYLDELLEKGIIKEGLTQDAEGKVVNQYVIEDYRTWWKTKGEKLRDLLPQKWSMENVSFSGKISGRRFCL